MQPAFTRLDEFMSILAAAPGPDAVARGQLWRGTPS